MLEKIKNFLEFANKTGMYLPMAHDATRSAPSITLLILYISGIVSIGSVIALHFNDGLLTATGSSLLLLAMAFVMYKMRQLDKVKFNMQERSFELDAVDEVEEKSK